MAAGGDILPAAHTTLLQSSTKIAGAMATSGGVDAMSGREVIVQEQMRVASLRCEARALTMHDGHHGSKRDILRNQNRAGACSCSNECEEVRICLNCEGPRSTIDST